MTMTKFEPNRALHADDAATEAAIQKQFADLEALVAESNPGLTELLQVYGGYEAAVQQVEAYFTRVNQPPGFSSSNSSGS